MPTEQANRDHVAISRSGVYLLDSKRYDGEVHIPWARIRDYEWKHWNSRPTEWLWITTDGGESVRIPTRPEELAAAVTAQRHE